jgi:hypothetical protein
MLKCTLYSILVFSPTCFSSSNANTFTDKSFCNIYPNNEICNLEKLTASWFFDTSSNSCKMFIDGFCNEPFSSDHEINTFSSGDECLEVCGLNGDSAKVFEVVERAYLKEKNEEQKVLPVMSLAVGNKMARSGVEPDSEPELVELQPTSKVQTQLEPVEPYNPPPFCQNQFQAGRCRAAFINYGYDPIKNTCQVFLYGGCEVNPNHFETGENCVKTCGNDLTRIVDTTENGYLRGLIETRKMMEEYYFKEHDLSEDSEIDFDETAV